MASEDSPENILFVMADQLAARHLHCYGGSVPSTPTLDTLARQGARFERCYATSPICTPSRATLLTGRSPVVHGMISNNYTLPPDNPTYAHVLGEHGYHVGGFGKFHHTPMPLPHPEDYTHLGFDESVISEDPKWGPWTEWIRTEHPDHFETALAMAWGTPRLREDEEPPDPRYTPPEVNEIRQRILEPIREASNWENYYTSPLPAELHQTTYITDLGIDYMRRRTNSAPEEPFFCLVSYVDPHDPYDPPEPYADMFDPGEMPDPVPAEWTADGNAILEGAREWQGFEDVSDDEEVIRELRAKFHGSLRFIDDQVARLLEFLEAEGLADDTLVVFTSDHGEMLGDQELMTKGVKPYDAGIRCPLIVSGPGVQSSEPDRLVSTLDFFPTFCDWAGVDPDARPPLEGHSFAGACAGTESRPWDDVQVAVGPVETLVSDDGWRLTVFDDDDSPNQLFDLTEDPDEQENLYRESAHAERRQEMLERLISQNVRVRRTSQYRNLPVWQGEKYEPDGAGNGQMTNPRPIYSDPDDFPTW